MTETVLRNSARWCASGARPLLLALIAVGVAFGTRFALHPLLQEYLPFFTFVVTALLVEFMLGIAAAGVVIVCSAPLAVYFFVRPYNSFDMPELSDCLIIAGNLAIMVLGTVLIESLQRARYHTRLVAEVAQSRYDMLLRADRERFAAQESARASHQRFDALASHMSDVWYLRRVDRSFEYVKAELYSLTGAERGTLTDGRWLSVMHPEDADEVAQQFRMVGVTGDRMLSTFRLRLRSGDYAVFEGYLSRSDDDVSTVVKWSGGPVAPQPSLLPADAAIPA